MRRALLLLPLATTLAACGSNGGPQLDRSDAGPLIDLAARIAHEAPCDQSRDIAALRLRVTRLANTGRVSPELLEPLSSAVNELALEAPKCS